MPRSLPFFSMALGSFLLLALPCRAQNVSNYEAIAEPLLFLLREPAVQQDLALTRDQQLQLTALNERLDGDLLSSRNMPPEQAQQKVAHALSVTREEIATVLDDRQRDRLRQITFRVRGIPFVLLPEVAQQLTLTDEQRQSLDGIVRRTAVTIAGLQQQIREGQTSTASANQAAAAARKEQQVQVLEQLTDLQRKQLLKLIGPTFDPNQLGRVSFKSPELPDADTWINSEPLKLAQLRGQVVVLHFWAFGCINCIHNYPWYRDWHTRYANQDVVMIGVHTPETSTERQVDRVREKAEAESLKFPIVVDNDQAIWNAWGNSIWPSVYLIDKRGRLRFWWYGELNWDGAGGQEIMARRSDELRAEAP
jgi:peroxiredoxin